MRLVHSFGWFVVLLALTGACRNPLEEVRIHTKDPITTGIINIHLYDPAGNPVTGNSQITLAGPNADKIVTPLNTTQYEVNDEGNLLLAISPSVEPTVQQPVRFTIIVDREGCMPVVQDMVVTSRDNLRRSLCQISSVHPLRSLSAGRINGHAGADGAIGGPMALLTPPPIQSTDQASVLLEPGARLTDRDGKPITGNIVLRAVYTNDRKAGADQLPGGGILSNVATASGTAVLGTFRMISIAGSMTLDCYSSDYQVAHTSSQPMTWHMDLNPTTINPYAGRTVQPGDSIPLFSYDVVTNHWQQEPSGVVMRSTGGRMAYQATASRFLTYVAVWPERVCASGPVFAVTSPFTDVDVNYLCKLIDAQTGALAGSFWANVNNGSEIRIQNQPVGRQLKLQVFDQTDAWGKGARSGLIAESRVGMACDQTSIPLSLTALTEPSVTNLTFTFACPHIHSVNESLLPAQLMAQYSPAGKDDWHTLGLAGRFQQTVKSYNVKSYKLKPGQRYDVRASIDGGSTWPLRETNYLIDKPEWALTIRSASFCQ